MITNLSHGIKYKTNLDTQHHNEKCIEYLITQNGCWECQNLSRNKAGYTTVFRQGKSLLLHRVSYCDKNNLSLSDIEDFVVMHACDNPACFNPSHLSLGTRGQNNRDRHEKGRTVGLSGSLNGRSKLSPSQVEDIRLDARANTVIASEYGVSPSTIGRIKNNKTYKKDTLN